MLIDCDSCVGQGVHCDDCVISVLLTISPPARGAPRDRPVELDPDTRVAFAALADGGLVPPLRLVRDQDLAAG